MSAVSRRLFPSRSYRTYQTGCASAPSEDDTNPVLRSMTRREQTLFLRRLRQFEQLACTRLPVNNRRLAVLECKLSLWRLLALSTMCLSTERRLFPTDQ